MAVTPVAGAVPITQFTPAQQTQLRAGQAVGNFQVLNGHVMDLRTTQGQALLQQRQANAPTPTAAPATATPASSGPTGLPKGGWMNLGSGGVVQPPPQSPVDTSKDAANRDALAFIRSTLAQYGLPDSLADWAWGEIVAGKGTAEVMLDLRQRPEFKAEFGDVMDARQKAGLSALSPADIISYRNDARQMMRAAGLPTGFFDTKQEIDKRLADNMSLKELGDRLADWSSFATSQTSEQDRQEFYRMGFGHGDLTALIMNPDVAEPLLHQQFAASQLSGQAVRSGYGGLNADQAIGLTQQGVSQAQAQEGFAALQHQTELYGPLDAGETAIGRQDQLDAQFGGNANAQQRIQDRARRRIAEFSGGGQFASSQQGMTGLGRSGQ